MHINRNIGKRLPETVFRIQAWLRILIIILLDFQLTSHNHLKTNYLSGGYQQKYAYSVLANITKDTGGIIIWNGTTLMMNKLYHQ